MAQITNSTLGFNAWDIAAVTYPGSGPGFANPAFFIFSTANGVAPFNNITAFSVVSDIVNTGGSITGTIDAISIATDTGAPELSITDLSVQAASLFVPSGGVAGWEAFWETVLAGGTTFNLSQGPMNMMGDYAVVNAGQTKAGAVDTFTGAVNGLNGYFSGDAINVETGATLTGAADIFLFNSIIGVPGGGSVTLVGDVGGNGVATTGRVNGGADGFTINVTQSQFAPIGTNLQLYGDVERMAVGGVLFGGADVISLTNLSSVGDLVGDVRDATGAEINGGNDSITLETSVANLLFLPSNVSMLSGDSVQVDDGVLRGGADTIIVRNTNGSSILGDVSQLNNATFIGGDDAITVQNTATAPEAGGPPVPPSSISLISGDSIQAGGTGDFTGGSDTINAINVISGQILGDAAFAGNSGFFSGGHDIINYIYNYFLSSGGSMQIFGDVQAAGNVSFTGGNDTITVTGSRGSGSVYQLVGDAVSYNTAVAGSGVFTGGNDTITFNSLDPTTSALIIGDLGASTPVNNFTGGNDHLTGGAGDDQIFGDSQSSITATTIIGGNDQLDGRDGNDTLDGGGGSDTAVYSSLNKSVFVNLNGILGAGTSGDYFEAMGQGFDQLINIENVTGSSLNDILIGDDLANILTGGDGSDRLLGRDGADRLVGDGGTDFLIGGDGADTLLGGAGTDQLYGGLGVDSINGGLDDSVDFARYDDANYGNLTIRLDNSAANAGAAAVGDSYVSIEGLVGGVGNDTIVGDNVGNFLFGLGGNDTIYGLGGADNLYGGEGTNQLYGGVGADQHTGGSGIDYARYDDANYGNLTIRLDAPSLNTGVAAGDTYTGIEGLVGGLGNDIIVGNASNNQLFGGGGVDNIFGQGGSDYLSGGAGADRFVFSTALGAGNVDTIADFVHLTDDIQLATVIFATIGATLDATELRFGSAAADANDFIIYNGATGQLFYDANGNGAGGQTLFATVTAGTVLDIGDFVMV